MKIAFLNFSFGAVNRGGEVFVAEVSQRLKNKGHKIEVISAHKPYRARWPVLWRVFLDPQGIQICLFTLKNLPRIWRKKYDIVIPVDGGWQPAWVRLITWLYGGKMVIAGQSGIGWDDRNNLWSLPNVFVGLTSYQTRWARKTNPFVKVVTIPNGVNLEEFSQKVKPLKINLPKPIILAVGALVPVKRHHLTIEAVARLAQGSLVIIGQGSEEKRLESLAKRRLGKRFLIKSFQHQDMPGIYKAADLFVYPTVPWESFGIVLVEAMAAGLPIVATDDPIRKEIVGQAGILVDPEDIDLYTKAIAKVLKAKWGGKPRKQAEKFDWDKIAEKYDQLFQSLC